MSSIDQASEQSSEAVRALAHESGFSAEAVETMRRSVARGGGRMAQFDHREFGGMGQWMRGGMLMIGEPSNHELKRRIDALCDALSSSLSDEAERVPDTLGGHQRQSQSVGAAGPGRPDQPTWYPASLGTPDASGNQNDLRYAWFAPKRRLVVDRHGVVTLHDTGDHRIAGVSQQQGFGRTLTFSSQHGDIDVDRLPVVDGSGAAEQRAEHSGIERDPVAARPVREEGAAIDPFVALEKLADLHARGVLDGDEFASKKSELLKRI